MTWQRGRVNPPGYSKNLQRLGNPQPSHLLPPLSCWWVGGGVEGSQTVRWDAQAEDTVEPHGKPCSNVINEPVSCTLFSPLSLSARREEEETDTSLGRCWTLYLSVVDKERVW